LDGAVDLILGIALLGELTVVFVNVLSRTLVNRPILWTEEITSLALSILAFIGGAIAYRRQQHTSVQALLRYLPEPQRQIAAALTDWVIFGIAVLTSIVSVPLLVSDWGERTPILGLRATWIAAPLPAGMALLAVYALDRLSQQTRRPVVLVGTALLLTGVAVVLARPLWAPLIVRDLTLWISLGCFIVTVVVGLPVGFALMLGTVVYLYPARVAPLVALSQNMVDGMGNFVLLALPFFILAGAIMEKGGLSTRLVEFVRVLVGHLRGGLLQVMILSMYLVSGLSGAKTADVAAVGSVMRDMLRREGYDLEEGAAVLAASAAMGETVPPSIAMLVLGSITSLSVAALFIAGLVPAAVVALWLMAMVYLRARRAHARPGRRASWRERGRAAAHAVLPLLMPAILFGGILMGVATPTEVSSFAVVYGLALAVLAYRAITARSFKEMVVEASTVSGMILFILAAATSFSWALAVANLPQRLVGILTGLHAGEWVFLIGSIIVLIVLGSLLEGLPALLILAPLLLPVATQVGVSPLHYGILLLIAMGIGAFAPPVGVGVYVACAVARTTLEKSSRTMIPYLVVLMLGLLMVTFFPWFTLALPAALKLGR